MGVLPSLSCFNAFLTRFNAFGGKLYHTASGGDWQGGNGGAGGREGAVGRARDQAPWKINSVPRRTETVAGWPSRTAVADAEGKIAGEVGAVEGVAQAGEGDALGAVAMAEDAHQRAAGAVREGEGGGRAVGRVGGGAGGGRGAGMLGAEVLGAEAWDAEMWDAEAWDAEMWGAEMWGAEASGAEASGAGVLGAEVLGAEASGAEASGAEAWDAEMWDAGASGAEVLGCGGVGRVGERGRRRRVRRRGARGVWGAGPVSAQASYSGAARRIVAPRRLMRAMLWRLASRWSTRPPAQP